MPYEQIQELLNETKDLPTTELRAKKAAQADEKAAAKAAAKDAAQRTNRTATVSSTPPPPPNKEMEAAIKLLQVQANNFATATQSNKEAHTLQVS